MRPISLTATAFGPFAQTQTIDFTKLGARSFFLIEGPIGSGKTSILDAICFALYGVSSGDEREGSDLRSHHAKPETLTTVIFEFELGSGETARRYRVQRAPTQVRPAQRGEDRTVTVQTTATIWEVTPNGTEVATTRGGIKDVNAKVEQLIGVSADQFRQVIMLPQGKFREFLAADSGGRRTVLEKLFGTEVYRRIEEELREAGREAADAATRARTDLEIVLGPRGVQTVEALISLREETDAAATARRAEATAAGTRAAEAEAALAAGTEAGRLIAERTTADAAVAILEADLPARQADRARLDAGRKALPVVPVEGQVEEARKRRDTAAQELAARRLAATAAHEALELAHTRLATEQARNPEREAATQRVQELDHLTQAVADLATLRAALVEAQTAATTADTAVTIAEAADAAAAKALEDLLARIGTLQVDAAKLDGARAIAESVARQVQARADLEANRKALATAITTRAGVEAEATRATEARAALEARIGDLRAIAARQEGASLRATAVATNLRSRQALDADRASLAKATTAHATAVATHATTVIALEAARTHRDATFHAWTAGLAGRLANTLVEGDPCPVCGSDHHPSPTTPGGADASASDEDLEAADHALTGASDAERRAAEAVAARQSEVDNLNEKVATAVDALGDDATVSVADLQGRKAQADTDLGAIAAATAELVSAEAGIEAARTAERDATEAATAARTTVDQLEGTVTAAITALGDDATVALPELQGRKAKADGDLQAAQKASDDLADASGREPAVRQAAEEARTHTAQAREAATQATLARTGVEARTDVAAKAVPADLATPEALAAARSVADALVASLEASLAAATAQERAANDATIAADTASTAAETADHDRARELEQAVATLDQVVRDAGFSSVDDWRAACLTPPVLAEIDARLTAFDASLAQAQDRAARAREAATNVEAPDLEALTTAVAAARAAHTAAHDAATLTEATAKELVGDVTRAEAAKHIADEALNRQTRVHNLATIARGVQGGSVPRISFQSYVLARVLDQVLDAATLRLLKVSQGRYEVRRRLEARSRVGQAGLDIEILDRYTGQARDARTLSGGESFQASLSLAFGLSDVVQQHVGGVHLDCIFVDEGFGSLDPEALDNALAMLKELQVNGRLVGIISHVGDLRQHIDARLTLTRTPNGSTATFHL
ncbi:MAG: SMC family ATPase [Chloroflexi bacterium]|nr:SMC family ATPase [Chloroflexota bacterium]